MRVVPILLLLIACMARVSPAMAQPRRVVVYAAMDETVISRIVRAFTERTGIQVEMLTVAAAGTVAARIVAEKARPRADIFVGGSIDFHAPLAAEGILMPYRSPAVGEAKVSKDFLDPQGRWSGWYLGVLGIVVNRPLFDRTLGAAGVPLPRTWDDLLQPAFKGHLALPSPVTTGGGYIFLATQFFRLGEERGWAYLKALSVNTSQFAPTVPAAMTLVERGEAILGMNWAHVGLIARNRGVPIDIVIPADTGFEIGGVSIIKGGPNPDGAREFVDFVFSRLAQDIAVKYHLTYPVRPDVPSPMGMPAFEGIRLVKYDREWAIAHMTRIRERWTRDIGR
ncbi:MAG: ABC transporter substrate-binding protein [Armatimonadota bacterium]|nr:ABC transporter substrate-binding protein [Armatimonadota bacterium]